LDYVLIFGVQHLRQILTSYSSYYNKTRTHLSLDKDAPLRLAVQRCGTIVATPILSGLHHQYARIQFSGTTGPLGLVMYDFGARTGHPAPIAVVEFEAASAAA
jgi:hypothetical protein